MVNNNFPQCRQVFVENDPAYDYVFQVTNQFLANYNLVNREIWGDGNCRFYASLLGLAYYGKVPVEVFNSDTSLAAVMLHLYQQVASFLGEKSKLINERTTYQIPVTKLMDLWK